MSVLLDTDYGTFIAYESWILHTHFSLHAVRQKLVSILQVELIGRDVGKARQRNLQKDGAKVPKVDLRFVFI